MNARQVDDATTRLHDLQIEGIGDLALAVLATGLALTATQVRPALAIPFLLGAFAVGFLGLRAYVRRTFLVEDLAGDPDAYTIPAVRRFALRATAPQHRHDLARSIRIALTGSSGVVADRFRAVQPELEELVVVLEDDDHPLDPYAIVTLERWLNDPCGSFRDPDAPVAELRSRLRSEVIELGRHAIP
jgi:hypothetical protein